MGCSSLELLLPPLASPSAAAAVPAAAAATGAASPPLPAVDAVVVAVRERRRAAQRSQASRSALMGLRGGWSDRGGGGETGAADASARGQAVCYVGICSSPHLHARQLGLSRCWQTPAARAARAAS